MARRSQVTIPEEAREEVGINVGDVVEVSSLDGRVAIEKVVRNWEKVIRGTRGVWKSHPVLVGMKDSVEITHWLRRKHEN